MYITLSFTARGTRLLSCRACFYVSQISYLYKHVVAMYISYKETYIKLCEMRLLLFVYYLFICFSNNICIFASKACEATCHRTCRKNSLL